MEEYIVDNQKTNKFTDHLKAYLNVVGNLFFRSLINCIKTTNSIITGNSVLFPICDIYTDIDYVILNIYVPYSQRIKFFQHEIFKTFLSRKNVKRNIPIEYTYIQNDNIYNEKFADLNHFLYSFHIECSNITQGKYNYKFNITIINDDTSPVEVVKNHCLSFLQIWYDGDNVKSNFDPSILDTKPISGTLHDKFNELWVNDDPDLRALIYLYKSYKNDFAVEIPDSTSYYPSHAIIDPSKEEEKAIVKYLLDVFNMYDLKYITFLINSFTLDNLEELLHVLYDGYDIYTVIPFTIINSDTERRVNHLITFYSKYALVEPYPGTLDKKLYQFDIDFKDTLSVQLKFEWNTIKNENLDNKIIFSCPDKHLHYAGACGFPVEIKKCNFPKEDGTLCQYYVGGSNHFLAPGCYLNYINKDYNSHIWIRNSGLDTFGTNNFALYNKLYDQQETLRKNFNNLVKNLILKCKGEPDNTVYREFKKHKKNRINRNTTMESQLLPIIENGSNQQCFVCNGNENIYKLPCGHFIDEECLGLARGLMGDDNTPENNELAIQGYDKDGNIIDTEVRKCGCRQSFLFGTQSTKVAPSLQLKKQQSQEELRKIYYSSIVNHPKRFVPMYELPGEHRNYCKKKEDKQVKILKKEPLTYSQYIQKYLTF